jgi:integrase
MGPRVMRRLPKFVHGYIDRHGKPRHYLRRPGFKTVPLRGLPWSPEFMAAYEAVMSGDITPRQIGASRVVVGSVHELVASYLGCSLFNGGAPETRRTRRNILERFREAHGHKRIYFTDASGKKVMLLTREHMQQIVNEKAETPFAQRNFLNTMRALFRWARSEGKIPDDPTLGVTRKMAKTTGYKTWSEGNIETFEAAHPIGSRARLAFALALYTGQRRGDLVKMGRQHIHNGILTIDQSKTEGGEEAHLEIPVHPKLGEIIEASPSNHLTFLTTAQGSPFSPAGFTNWFRDMCNAAGLPKGLSAHGLRKAAARRLAELGCSAHEIASITGHASISEVQRYTTAADRKRLAQSAMRKLIEGGS